MATRRPPTKAQVRRQQLEAAITYPLDWLEERSGLVGATKYFLFRKVPGDANWMQTLGSATLTAFLSQFLRSGAEIGGDTLARFYSIHMLLLPGAIIGLIGLHLYLVIRLGVASPPWSKTAAGMKRVEEPSTLRPGLTRPAARETIAAAQGEPAGGSE